MFWEARDQTQVSSILRLAPSGAQHSAIVIASFRPMLLSFESELWSGLLKAVCYLEAVESECPIDQQKYGPKTKAIYDLRGSFQSF